MTTHEHHHQPEPEPEDERGAGAVRTSGEGRVIELRPDGPGPAHQPGPATAAAANSRGPDTDSAGPDSRGGPAPDGQGSGLLVDAAVQDGPAPSRLAAARAAQRRAVLPAWARDRAEAGQAARWAAGHAGHAAAFHAVRAPLYAGRLAGRAPRGAGRALGGFAGWVTDAETRPLRIAAARSEDPHEYLKLAQIRDARVRLRAGLALAVVLALAAAGVLVATAGTGWQLVTAALLVLVLGIAGREPDRPVAGPAVVATRVEKLTSSTVTRALAALGIAEIARAVAKNGHGIGFPKPITRDGPGWRADVDLPHGVTVSDIVERRDKLASGLRRPLGCVWPEGDPDAHAGRLLLWVGDQDLSKARQPAWPLAKTGAADIFRPIPFGSDQRGRPVEMTLAYNNVLIGAMPGVGKTFALRVLLLAAALDARVQLRIFELKGSGDLSALEPVAHHYGSGPDDATIAAALDSLREIHRELETRARTISRLPRSQCPENKVTPTLAARPDLGLHPVVVAVDECQELFSHPASGKEAAELATAIIKRGRALGVTLLLATQRPDKDSLPTGISANVGIRFCLRVMGQVENDLILGTSAYRTGIRATTFTAKDKGIGYLLGAADDPHIARAAYLDNPAAEKITARARGLREHAGTLTGHAAGETTTTQQADTLIEDLLAALPAAAEKVWTDTALEHLAQAHPGRYGAWEPDTLAAALRAEGIRCNRQIWGTDPDGTARNRRGLHRGDLTTTLTQRHQPSQPHQPDRAS